MILLELQAQQAGAVNNTDHVVTLSIYPFILIGIARWASLIINLILICVGLVVNVLVIFIFCQSELRKLTISIHTIGLAVSDICLLCISVFLKWLSEYEHDFEIFRTEFWCRTHGYFDLTFCCWSAWNIVCLSYERYLCICKQSKIYAKSAKKRALIAVTLLPFICLIFFAWYPYMIRWENMSTHNNQSNDSHELITYYDMYLNEISFDFELFCQPYNKYFFLTSGLVSVTVTYIVPFVLIAFFNCNIVRTLNNRIKKKQDYFELSMNFSKRNKSVKSNGKESQEKNNETSSIAQAAQNLDDITSPCSSHIATENKDSGLRKSFKLTRSRKSEPNQGRHNSWSRNDSRDQISESEYNVVDCMQNNERKNHLNRIKNDQYINRMLMIVSATFLCLTLPFQLIWLVDQFYKILYLNSNGRNDHISSQNLDIYQLISYCLLDIAFIIRNLNFSINFFLYSTLSNLFRQELNKIFWKVAWFKRNVETTAS